MADQTITPQHLGYDAQVEVAAADYEDLTAANDGIFTVPDADFILHVIDAAGGAIITMDGGTDGVLSSQGDKAFTAQTIALNNFYGPLQTSRFKVQSGTDKGKIRVKTSAAVKAAVLVLP